MIDIISVIITTSVFFVIFKNLFTNYTNEITKYEWLIIESSLLVINNVVGFMYTDNIYFKIFFVIMTILFVLIDVNRRNILAYLKYIEAKEMLNLEEEE